MKQPINFINNNTFVFEGGRREYFHGEKEYTTLPQRQKIKVNQKNIWEMIRPIFIPISQICANIKEYQFRQIQDNDEIGFYDLECDDSENFILGYVNEEKFTDPNKMVKKMMDYNVLVTFNGLKFDNHILKKHSPSSFVEIKNADFSAFTINGKLIVDIMAILKIDVTLESYGAEFLAKHNKFPEELLGYDSNKNEKCKQDIRILKFLYEKYNIKKVFNKLIELANIDTTLLQVIRGERVRKWILINAYLKRGYLPLKTNKARQNKVELGVVKHFKEGLYENMIYWDCKSAYMTTAINLGNLGIYDNDNTFSELQKELKELTEDKYLKSFMKSIGNSLAGIQYSLNEHWRNDDIFEKIVNTFGSKVKNILNSREDVVYTNTDCWIVPKNSPPIALEGYDIKADYEFKFLYIYNQNKWIGLTKEGVKFKGFRRLNSTNQKIFYYVREEILEKLSKASDSEEFKELLDDTKKLASKTIKNLKKFPKEDLKITIRKTDEYCKNLEYADIWNQLKIGFNEIFIDKKGDYTLDSKKIGYKNYENLLIEYSNEFNTSK